MPDDFTPRHLRGIPESRRRELSPEREEELRDLQTEFDRDRRRRASERDPDAPEPWAFPVPRPMALLFDALPSPFTVEEALAAAEPLGLDAGDVPDAIDQMRRRELVSDTPEGYVKHPEAKNWF